MIRLPYSGDIWRDLGPSKQFAGCRHVQTLDGSTDAHVPPSHLGAARATDPVTSHEAARRQTPAKVRSEHRLVLQLLAKGPMTDFDLASLASIELKRTVKSVSLGVRRGELVRMGLVRNSGTFGVSDTGSRAIRWAITDAGRKELAA